MVSDFEDVARLRGAAPDALAQAAAVHREIVSAAARRHGGVGLDAPREGTAAAAVFRRPAEALRAALETRDAVHGREWPGALDLRARIAIHTADVSLGLERNHLGLALGRCEHLAAIARGDQILLSQATYDLLAAVDLPGGELLDLGVHRLPDLGRPEHVYGLTDSDPASAHGELRSLDTSPNNLPGNLTSFVGRERELAEVHRILAAARLLTLTGAGGCGKTRLALQAAANALGRQPDGVWWVDLAAVADPAMVGQALADAAGVRTIPGRSPLDAAVAHLSTRRALVVFDNCEHLLDGVAHAAEALLAGCPEVTLLATSRAPLGLPVETTWRVPSLSLPESGDGETLHAIAMSDAVRLFVARASAMHADFAVAEASAAALASLCRELDGIPLAIELAAARVRLLAVEQIAAGLRDRFRLLTGGSRTALPRHRTLRASVDWSHELLTDEERTLLRRLGVFAGGFTLAACEQVCTVTPGERDRVIDVLGSLVDNSLVMVEEHPSEVRYRLLETVREYALERLDEAGEEGTIRDRHRDFFLALAESLAPALESARIDVALIALDADGANLDAALRRAIETDGDRALRLCVALTFWWRMRGLLATAEAGCAGALAAADPAPTSLRARVLCARSYVLTFGGRFEEALNVAREALSIAEEVDDGFATARALGAIERVQFGFDPIGARPIQKRAIELARESGDDWCVGTTAVHLAFGHVSCDEYSEAVHVCEELIRPTIDRGSCPDVVPWYWLILSLEPMVQGDGARFFPLADRALAAAREIGDPMTEGYTNLYTAIFEVGQGRAEEALARLEASRERVVTTGFGWVIAPIEMMVGATEATLGDHAGARARLDSLVQSGATSATQRGWAMAQLADVLRVSGDGTGAEAWARRALEVTDQTPAPRVAAWSNEILGRLASDRGEWTEAESFLHEAIALLAERDLRIWLPQTLDALAIVAAGLASYEEATRLLGAAEGARSDLELVRWAPDQPRFAAFTDDLRARMGEEAFGAAWAEGAGLALEEAVAWVRRSRGSRKRPPGGWESLTPTELEVVRHAAAGATNTEIGQMMFITGGTVKTHLSHIYAKLGLRNRAELSAEAARRLPSRASERAGLVPD